MNSLMKSMTVSISIDRDPKTVYEFIYNLTNLPKWAKMLCLSIKQQSKNGEWIIKTPQGDAKIRLTRKNKFNILYHYVSSAPGVEVFVPMRVVPNHRYGSEVMLTVFQTPDISQGKFTEDVGLVNQDLRTMRRAS